MKNYMEWLKAMGSLPGEAEFCLMDATERVTAGDKTVEFLITEAEGYERAGRRSGRDVFRTRLFLTNPQNPEHIRIEVNENYLASIDKSTISSWGFSLRAMYVDNRALFEGACQSLKQKTTLVGEQSKALLEATLSEQITRRITERLQGGDAGGDLRQMLDDHVREKILHNLIDKVARASRGNNLNKLGIRQDNNFAWEYNVSGGSFDLEIGWKSLSYRYLGRNDSVFPAVNNIDAFCVRDAFMFSVNLPVLGDQVAGMIEKVSRLTA